MLLPYFSNYYLAMLIHYEQQFGVIELPVNEYTVD